MKRVNKFSLALAALSLLSGAAFAQTQNIPIPASSVYNNAYAVVAVTIPVLPADICTASNSNCYNPAVNAPVFPTQSGPSGMYCGRAAVYTDNMSITDRVACDGHLVAYTAYYQAWMPPQPGGCYGGDNPTCYPDSPGYYYYTSSFATDCPSGYRVTTTGSSGPYQYYACIKA